MYVQVLTEILNYDQLFQFNISGFLTNKLDKTWGIWFDGF